MADALDKLADDIKTSTVEMCAKIAGIHRINRPDNGFQDGYNAAVEEIAAKIRELNKPKPRRVVDYATVLTNLRAAAKARA